MAENFDLIFGQNASQQYAWNDTDYLNGWETIGNIPPTAAQFDALQRRSDTKMKELNDELTPLVSADTADSRQPSTAYSVDDIKYSSLLPTGWYLLCTTAGTTSASELVITSPTVGGTVTDGTVVWTINKVASTADVPAPVDISGKANVDLDNLSAAGEAKIQTVSPRYLTDSYYNAAASVWYRVYSDGWVEQGGYSDSSSNTTTTVTFLKPMKNSNYFAIASRIYPSSNAAGQSLVLEQTTTTLKYALSVNRTYWYVCGMGA
jgi:hypothetical protein